MVLNQNTSLHYQYQLEPEIYCLKGLLLLKIAKEKNLYHFPIHIKLDTGMHRLGFEDDSMDELIATLKGNETVKVQSILSHLATSDDLKHRDFTLSQINLFENVFQNYSRIGNKPYSSYFDVRDK
jgi:alanine racemase